MVGGSGALGHPHRSVFSFGVKNTKSILGTRVRLEYFDQNESFASVLPRQGVIARQLRAAQGVDDWFAVDLDEPFDYQIKFGEPFRFRLLHCECVLVRSRWQGYRIGEVEPTSVFILLIPDRALLMEEPIRLEDFHHVAWGMCHTEKVEPGASPNGGLAMQPRNSGATGGPPSR